jgi:dihydrofolate synthase/folylpolyglutamate synthase
MLRLLAGIGNPHKKFKTIHVAGTKGKGSTCHMLAAILAKAGYRTGLYTSPHVVELRERIAVNGQMISEAGFTRLLARIAPVVKRLRKDSPTYFDVLTAAAFLHFANEEVDVAVVETGLGGRLDSTNVIKPDACAITSISFDHMAQLGATLPAIAEEKAGIFKPGAPVISAPQPPEVTKVLREAAARLGTTVKVIGEDLEFSYRFERSRGGGPHSRVCLATPQSRFDHLQVPLLGEHQATNCGVALGVLDALRQKGYEITEQHAIDGLGSVKVEGRLETIRPQPHTVVDGAHNAASVAALMRAIGQNISYDSMVVIFGCSADKDIDGMLDQLQLGADKVIFTTNGSPRSADPKELLTRFQERSQKMAMIAPTLMDAYRLALHCVTREDLICITGSFYLVGAAKQQLAGRLDL